MPDATITAGKAFPPHVPPELIWDNDLVAFAEAQADPYVGVSEEFHRGPDIRWVSEIMHGRTGWVVTRQDLQNEVFMSPLHFSSRNATDLPKLLGVNWPLIPNEIDPPVHMMYRQVLQPWFQPSAINGLEHRMREICRSLLDEFADERTCDFQDAFGLRFPSYIFLQLMGMPVDMADQFLAWEHMIFRGKTNEERLEALRSVLAYMTDFLNEKRRNPTEEDLASYLVTVKVKGRLLTEEELSGIALVLYTGGLDTVASSIGWYLMYLARNPDQQDLLRANPDLMPGAVEELLRAHGVTLSLREANRDLEFHGVLMRKGDTVALPQFLASRDARSYPDPHRLDFRRKGRNLTLATGPHNCLGQHLARREIKIVLEEWLKRFKNIRIVDENAITWAAPAVWSITRLPLAWEL